MNFQARLRSLERAKARLRHQEAALRKQAEAAHKLAARLEAMVKESGMTPRDLIFALVDQFQVRLAGRRKGVQRRRRTRITGELREALKKAVAGGASKLATAEKFRVSYAVVTKAVEGRYEALQ